MNTIKRALIALILAVLALPASAQVSGSGFAIIRAWDGTNVINIGDNANTAIRVNCITGCSSSASASAASELAAPATTGAPDM